VNALASRAEEGRGKLRKAVGSCKQALIHRYPNGATPHGSCRVTLTEKGVRGASGRTETSKYPEEKKSTEIPLVAASERGRA
jgi:hypothetical protein